MKKELKEKFTKQIVINGANRFGVVFEDLSYIGAWQNFIYEYKKRGVSYILRFSPISHRSRNQIIGELDWILYLYSNGVSVSKPIPSINGELTEVVEHSDLSFTVTSFVKAEGRKIGYPECLSDTDLYQELGLLTGKIHALSKKYEPKDETTRRNDQENIIDGCWLKQIPIFLKLREIIVYTGMYRSADITQLNQWAQDFISESKIRIENSIPVVNIW